MRLKENPIVYLSLKLWQYSEGRRKKVVLYLVMSWLANLAHLCIPMIFALLLNELQQNGVTEKNINYLLFLSFLFIVRACVTWALHGPSRMMENENALWTIRFCGKYFSSCYYYQFDGCVVFCSYVF